MENTVAAQHRTLVAEIRHVPSYAPFLWLYSGWCDMRRHWGASLGYGALIVALGWTLLVFCGTHPYFIAAAISGFLLVGPLMSAAFCEMSRLYSSGKSASFDDSLEGFARNARQLAKLGVILAIVAAGWFSISGLLLGTVFHVGIPNMSETLYQGFFDSTNRSQILAYISVGGVLATVVFTVTVITIPVVLDQNASVAQAVETSVHAVFRNIAAMLVWSALILSLTIVGYAPLLAGMIIIAPLLGHATWYAYADMLGRSLPARPVERARSESVKQTGFTNERYLNPNDERERHLSKLTTGFR